MATGNANCVCANLLSLMDCVSKGEDEGGQEWRATVDSAEQLARAFVELQTVKILVRQESQATDERVVAGATSLLMNIKTHKLICGSRVVRTLYHTGC